MAIAAVVALALSVGLTACGTGSGDAVGPSGASASVEASPPATSRPTTSQLPAEGERPVLRRGVQVPGAEVLYRDLAYDDKSPAQKLDLYLPDNGRRPYPLLVAIHGGGFSGGDKNDGQVTPVLAGLTRGYAVASLGYRLSSEAKFPAAISDVKAAVRWLRAHAAEYGLDARHIALWGDSAGGNLAALAGTSGDTKALRGPVPANAGYPDTVQAVVDWFGPISFLQTDADFSKAGFDHEWSAQDAGSFMSQYLGARLDDVPGKVKASDPITYLSPDDPPILIEHGIRDATVPYPQSVRLARAYARAAGKSAVTLHLLKEAGHVDPAFYSDAHVAKVLDWLDARLK